MELSGLIFVALALVWAVVLLPKALRQHDEVAQTRSVDGVSESMRVLARREAVSEREARLVRTPSATPAARRTVVPEAPTPEPRPQRTAMTKERVQGHVAQRKAAAAAARRRRRILMLLVAASVGVGVTAAVGRLPLWAPAIPVVVMLGFLLLARVLVRRERARRDVELLKLTGVASAPPSPAETADSAADLSVEAADVVVVAHTVEETRQESVQLRLQNAPDLAVAGGLDETSSFPPGLLDDVTPTTDAGSLWDPLPVTLPTYVSKPRAARSVRTIDLQAPGVSSSGHDAASSALVADAATSAPPDDLPQRAVGS